MYPLFSRILETRFPSLRFYMRFILYSVEPKVAFSTNLLSDCITQCTEEVLKYLLVLQAMTFEHFLTSQLFNKLIHVL